MLKTVIRRLFVRRNGIESRTKCYKGKLPATSNSLSPFSAKLICGDCGEYYGSRYGIPTVSTAVPFGSAMANSRASKNAEPLIYMKMTSKRCS
jgi:hypothetical protein